MKWQTTKCSPSTVSAPYSDMRTGFWLFLFHAIASSTTCDVIVSNSPGFVYQPLYRLKLIISKNFAYRSNICSITAPKFIKKWVDWFRFWNAYRFIIAGCHRNSSCDRSIWVQWSCKFRYRSCSMWNMWEEKIDYRWRENSERVQFE